VPVVIPPAPGVCGTANGTTTATAPSGSSLCATSGPASAVSGGATGPWSWTCAGTNGGAPSPICTATPPVVLVPGVCSTTVTGVQSSPLTTGGCAVGSVVSFVKNGTNPEVYTWKCQSPNGGADSNQCSASYVPPVAKSFSLSLKKYINSSGVDAQPGSEVNMVPGTVFNYIIRVTNDGPDAVTGETVVKDTLPAGVAIKGIPSGSPWVCNVSGVTVTCSVTAAIAAGQNFPDITIPVELIATTVGQTIRNDATVSNPGDTTPGNNTDPAIIIVKPAPACGSVT
jgi:uncharacterized repeat protein (TIGR01451 family)